PPPLSAPSHAVAAHPPSFPTRRSSDLSHLSDMNMIAEADFLRDNPSWERPYGWVWAVELNRVLNASELSELRALGKNTQVLADRSEEHTSELQSRFDIVCRLLLEKKNR